MDQSKQSPDFATARLQWAAQLQLRRATQTAVFNAVFNVQST